MNSIPLVFPKSSTAQLLLLGAFVSITLFLCVESNVFPLPLPLILLSSIPLFFLAYHRTVWFFFIFVASLPLETINVLPHFFPFTLQPYQWLLVILIIALYIQFDFQDWKNFFFREDRIDYLLLFIPLGATLSITVSSGEGIRIILILLSYVLLYLTARFFLVSSQFLRGTLVVLVGSSSAPIFLGFLQNLSFEFNGPFPSVMPGRPNGSFAEADWLGFFIGFILLIVLNELYRFLSQREERPTLFRSVFFLFALIPLMALLFMAVSRSAWLATFLGSLVWLVIIGILYHSQALRPLFEWAQLSLIAFCVALFLVLSIPLTRFPLLERAESTATGFQKITVACDHIISLPTTIQSLDDLTSFGCRHIFLEEKETLSRTGFFITTVERPDPNIALRATLYTKTWSAIKSHPIFGIGWADIGPLLGKDERGAAYNASNLWLEVWLGAGLLGVVGLLGFFVSLLFRIRKGLQEVKKGAFDSLLPLAAGSIVFFCVFNAFNSGLLLGFVWLLFACLPGMLDFSRSEFSSL